MHICQIPHVIFESTSHFSFKFCINLQCHQTKLLCTFLSSNIIYFGQTSQLKSSFLDFRVLESKFVKILMSVLKWQVNSLSNFALFFLVMTHNSFVKFKVMSYHLYFGQKDPIKVPILTLSSALVKICQVSQVFFQTTSQFFFKICKTLQCHER